MSETKDHARLAAEEWFEGAREIPKGHENDEAFTEYLDQINESASNMEAIIRKHYAVQQAEIERLRKVVAAADAMRATVYAREDHPYSNPPTCSYSVRWYAVEAYDVARKELT